MAKVLTQNNLAKQHTNISNSLLQKMDKFTRSVKQFRETLVTSIECLPQLKALPATLNEVLNTTTGCVTVIPSVAPRYVEYDHRLIDTTVHTDEANHAAPITPPSPKPAASAHIDALDNVIADIEDEISLDGYDFADLSDVPLEPVVQKPWEERTFVVPEEQLRKKIPDCLRKPIRMELEKRKPCESIKRLYKVNDTFFQFRVMCNGEWYVRNLERKQKREETQPKFPPLGPWATLSRSQRRRRRMRLTAMQNEKPKEQTYVSCHEVNTSTAHPRITRALNHHACKN